MAPRKANFSNKHAPDVSLKTCLSPRTILKLQKQGLYDPKKHAKKYDRFQERFPELFDAFWKDAKFTKRWKKVFPDDVTPS